MSIQNRKELLAAVKDFLNPFFGANHIDHEEFKALAKEGVKIPSISYPLTKADLSPLLFDLCLSQLGTDHKSYSFFVEEKQKLTGGAAAVATAGAGDGEADDVPAGVVNPVKKKGKKTLAGLRDHMQQAAAEIEAAKAAIQAEEEGNSVHMQTALPPSVPLHPGAVLVTLASFPSGAGTEADAVNLQQEVMTSVSAAIGDKVEAVAAPVVLSSSGNRQHVFPGLVVLQCRDQATAKSAASTAESYNWGFASQKQSGVQCIDFIYNSTLPLAATALQLARHAANENSTAIAGRLGTGEVVQATRGKRDRDETD